MAVMAAARRYFIFYAPFEQDLRYVLRWLSMGRGAPMERIVIR
jgi:hypothetical protein